MTNRELFIALYQQGKFVSPRTGDFLSTTQIGRIMGISDGRVRDFIVAHAPDMAERLKQRGPKSDAFYKETRERFRNFITEFKHVQENGKFKPAYLLAADFGISVTTFMRWARANFPAHAEVWSKNECNPYHDEVDVRHTRTLARKAARKSRQYAKRVNTRRINTLRKNILPPNTENI
jgi:hypothetical protein